MTEWRARATWPAILLTGWMAALPLPVEAHVQANGAELQQDSVVRGPIEIDAVLAGSVRPAEYTSVLGARAAWLGREDGTGDIWVHPLLVASNLSVSVVDDSGATELPVSSIEVGPQGTMLVRRVGDVTVRQHVVVPADEPAVVALFDVDAPRDITLRARFTPVLQLSWPGSFGGQYAFWDDVEKAYVVSESLQRRNAVVGSPTGTPVSGSGSDVALDIPVTRAAARFGPVPLVFTAAEADRGSVMNTYKTLVARATSVLADRRSWVAGLEARTVRLDTPEDDLDRAFAWAKLDLVSHRTCNPTLGCGMARGWQDGFRVNEISVSGDFGGREAGLGAIALVRAGMTDEARDVIRFQARHQRADGKIPGRIPQSAVQGGWYEDPEAFSDGLATPLWLLALYEYWKVTGDTDLVAELWPTVATATDWLISLETDDNGIVELDGAGAIPDGPLTVEVHEDAYLAGIWLTAVNGVASMASEVGEHVLANLAADLYRLGRQSLNQLFWHDRAGHHAFGLLAGGGRNDALTVWPVVGAAYGQYDQLRMGATLTALSTEELNVDWGLRSLRPSNPLYDPERVGYGAVDPVATGFGAWADYRYRRPWSALPNVLALSRGMLQGSRGRMATSYSGAAARPLNTALPQSSAVSASFISSVLGGLLGWETSATLGSASLTPQLPASWDSVRVENLTVGDSRVSVTLTQSNGRASARFSTSGDRVALTYVQAVPIGARSVRVQIDGRTTRGLLATGEHDQQVRVELSLRGGEHTVDVSWTGGARIGAPQYQAQPEGTQSLRIVNVLRRGANLSVQVDGEAGETYTFDTYGDRLRPAVNADGLVPTDVRVLEFDEETGRSRIQVTLPRGVGRAVVDLDFVS